MSKRKGRPYKTGKPQTDEERRAAGLRYWHKVGKHREVNRAKAMATQREQIKDLGDPYIINQILKYSDPPRSRDSITQEEIDARRVKLLIYRARKAWRLDHPGYGNDAYFWACKVIDKKFN